MATNKARIEITARDRTKAAFRSVSAGLASIRRTVFSVKTALAGLVAVGAVKKALDYADAIGKTADSIGVTTDALQEYRYAADISGVSTEALDSALRSFAKRVGEAKSNTGTLITILKTLDPALLANIKNARDMGEAFDLVIKKGAGMSNQLDRAALFAAAFGKKAGVGMTNLIKDGVGAMEALRREAQELGIVMDEGLIRGAERAKDDLTRLAGVLKVQLASALVSLAPFISGVAQDLVDLAQSARIAWGDIANLPDSLVVRKLEDLGRRIQEQRDNLAKAQAGEKDNSVLGALRGLITRDSEAIQADLDDLEAKYETALQRLGEINTAGTKSGKTPPAVITNDTLDAAAAMDKLEKEADTLKRRLRTPFEVAIDAIARYDLLLEKDLITVDTWGRAMNDALDGAAEGFEDVEDKAKTTAETIAEAMEGMASTIESSITSAVTSASISLRSLADLAGSILTAIAQSVISQVVAKPISDAIVGAFKGPVKRASGGRVAANSFALVGEQGPEMIQTGAQSAFVTPNGGGGSGETNINFTIVAADTRDFDRLLVERKGMITGMIQGAFAKQGLKGMAR